MWDPAAAAAVAAASSVPRARSTARVSGGSSICWCRPWGGPNPDPNPNPNSNPNPNPNPNPNQVLASSDCLDPALDVKDDGCFHVLLDRNTGVVLVRNTTDGAAAMAEWQARTPS